MTLRAARILSSETDNTIKQEQNTNVNIKITPRQQGNGKAPSPIVDWPQQPVPGNVNFTQANQPKDSLPAGQALHTQTSGASASLMMTPESLQYPSAAATNSPVLLAQERAITDLGAEINDLEKKNKFLELLVEMYSENPLKVNSYVVCKSGTLMSMIKLLTDCDKVDFVLDDSEVGCGCRAINAKLIKIDKILITKDGRTEELKYCYNDIYTEFIRYGISLKLVI